MKRVNLSGGKNKAPTADSNTSVDRLELLGWTVHVPQPRKRHARHKR